ncbi:MAG: hypothetical protein ACK4HV_04820 [Parachlamydiaceae bacterium]
MTSIAAIGGLNSIDKSQAPDENEDEILELPEPDEFKPKPIGLDILNLKVLSGFALPKVLFEIKEGIEKTIAFLENNVFPFILKSCGYFFQVIGLGFLVAGTIHTAGVLLTTPFAGGFFPVIVALIPAQCLSRWAAFRYGRSEMTL